MLKSILKICFAGLFAVSLALATNGQLFAQTIRFLRGTTGLPNRPFFSS